MKSMPYSKNEESSNDFLLCTGHFNSLKIFHLGILLKTFKTSDWIHCLLVSKVRRKNSWHPDYHIFIGLLDSTIEVLKIKN